ncbi:DUF72 domain-containing protein [Pedobacter aquatilis]|uniref:DUF72 domain-containing protein n=1 Tax=Pedobacter aquatilis TaxID=351343 RepID=UPI00338DD244
MYEPLMAYKFVRIIHDKAMVPSAFDVIQSDFRYLRFHGPDDNYRGIYSDDVLSEFVGDTEWLHKNNQVFVNFNNTMVNAYCNLNTLELYLWNIIHS